MNFLNLGCGYRFHQSWTNVDLTSTGEGIIAHNLLHRLPFSEATFECVYHSHVLEHLPKSAAQSFLQECYRVLSPSGVLRVVVPDLEELARTYLSTLEQTVNGAQGRNAVYEWMMLELLDQHVRNSSGGEMARYLSQRPLPGKEFILKRGGSEVENLFKEAHTETNLPSGVWQHPFLKRLRCFHRYPIYVREIFYKFLLGKDYRALRIGRFRISGEVHQWMYDRYSLTALLKQCGFREIVQRSATESYLSNWNSFHLDTGPDGKVYKPNSLYMEAKKP